MKKWIKYILLLFVLLVASHLYAQNLNDLNREQEKTRKNIELTNSLLKDTKKSSTVSLNRLQVINTQVGSRKKLIGQIEQELALTEGQIQTNTATTEKLKNDIQKVEQEYSKLLYNIYFRSGKYDNVMYILSASSVDMIYRRARYLMELSNYRKSQAEMLKKMQLQLDTQTKNLLQSQEKSKNLYVEKTKETQQLLSEKEQQNQYLSSLKQKEKDLKNQLSSYQKRAAQLNKQIQRIIAEQSKKNAKRSDVQKKVDVQLSSNFENNQGKLPWPAPNGIVISQFGKNQISHNIVIDNSGIDIQTSPKALATAVFNGEVTGIYAIQGSNNLVIVRHGLYLTIYSNLIDVAVKKGDIVTTGQKLGHIFTDGRDNNKTVLHFELWKETKKLNPESWLR